MMIKGTSFFIIIILVFITSYGCAQKTTRSLVYTYQEPIKQNDSIPTGNLNNSGMDSSQIIVLTKKILKSIPHR